MLSQDPRHPDHETDPTAALPAPAEAPEGEAGAPLLPPEPAPAGAAVKPPQALAWSRVVPLWRWFLFMVLGALPYQAYWYYNGWRLIAAHRRVKMRPLLRSIFFPFFVADFYRGVFDLARERGYPERPPLLPLSLAWVLFWAVPPLFGGYVALLQVVTIILLLPAAEALNFFWASVEEDQPVYRGVAPIELVLVAAGIALAALAMYAGLTLDPMAAAK